MRDEVREAFVNLLKKFFNYFVWSTKDILGMHSSIITHNINLYPNFPLSRQKKMNFSFEKIEAKYEVVKRLLRVNYIIEVFIQNG